MICRAGARFRVLVSSSSGLCYPVHSLVQGLCTKCAIEGLCVPHCPRAEGTVSERHDGPVVCLPPPPGSVPTDGANGKRRDDVCLPEGDSRYRGCETREGSGLGGGTSWKSVISFEKSTLDLPWRGQWGGQTSGQEKMQSP